MRSLLVSGITLLLLLIFSGCARFPSTITPVDTPPRTLYCEITVRGNINNADYYFCALGVDQTRATGPIPVVTGPELTNGWGTISGLPNGQVQEPPFYVEYHDGTFAQYRNRQYVGAPYAAGVSADGSTLWVEIDQRLLDPLVPAQDPIVQVNWMTMQSITVPPEQIGIGKEYDGFGRSGNDYLDNVPLTVARAWVSGEGTIPAEPALDTTTDPAYDMIGWRVEVRIKSTSP